MKIKRIGIFGLAILITVGCVGFITNKHIYAGNDKNIVYDKYGMRKDDPNNGNWYDQNAKKYNTSEAEFMVRVGDIDNFGIKWRYSKYNDSTKRTEQMKNNYNLFTGENTVNHQYPFYPTSNDPDGTDRIMVNSGYIYDKKAPVKEENGIYDKLVTDDYVKKTKRNGTNNNNVREITLDYSSDTKFKNMNIKEAVLQLFVDDFQVGQPVDAENNPIPESNRYYHRFPGKYIVTINGKEVEEISNAINSINQSGPRGKLLTVKIPIKEVKEGQLKIKIDDDGKPTKYGDGYGIDFVKLLINPKDTSNHDIKPGKIVGNITDSNGKPIKGATVSLNAGMESTVTNVDGYYEFNNVNPGLAMVNVKADQYIEMTANRDVVTEKISKLNFSLNKSELPGKPNIVVENKDSIEKIAIVRVDYSEYATDKQVGYVDSIDNTKIDWKPYNGKLNITKDQTIKARCKFSEEYYIKKYNLKKTEKGYEKDGYVYNLDVSKFGPESEKDIKIPKYTVELANATEIRNIIHKNTPFTIVIKKDGNPCINIEEADLSVSLKDFIAELTLDGVSGTIKGTKLGKTKLIVKSKKGLFNLKEIDVNVVRNIELR